jgi:hypothetical protein
MDNLPKKSILASSKKDCPHFEEAPGWRGLKTEAIDRLKQKAPLCAVDHRRRRQTALNWIQESEAAKNRRRPRIGGGYESFDL